MSEKNKELEFNRKNREEYEELVEKSSSDLSGYWDKNNIVVKSILTLLGIAIGVGFFYYFFTYMQGM